MSHFLSIVLVMASVAAVFGQSDALSPDEYAVYSELVNAKYLESWTDLAVIQTQTRLDTMRHHVAPKEFAHTLSAKNENTYTLERRFDIHVKYVLIDAKQLDELFRVWKQYPHATGLLSFSRVAFNSKGDEALLFGSEVCGSWCGKGYLFRLKKDQDRWKIVEEQLVWKS